MDRLFCFWCVRVQMKRQTYNHLSSSRHHSNKVTNGIKYTKKNETNQLMKRLKTRGIKTADVTISNSWASSKLNLRRKITYMPYSLKKSYQLLLVVIRIIVLWYISTVHVSCMFPAEIFLPSSSIVMFVPLISVISSVVELPWLGLRRIM